MTVKLPIYMDNHATTPVDPRVLTAMLPYFTEEFGNAASRNHVFGWHAEEAVEAAREAVGALIGASGKEIVKGAESKCRAASACGLASTTFGACSWITSATSPSRKDCMRALR